MKSQGNSYRSKRLLSILFLAGLGSIAQAGDGGGFTGPSITVGNGSAWVVVTVDELGEPESVSVVMNRDALSGLPEATAEKSAWEFPLSMPESGPRTGYEHVLLEWNPVGHMPEGVYTVAHFDVHFYMINKEAREAITFHGEGRDKAMAAPDPQLVPAGYVLPPDAAVDRMGMHGLDPAGKEFQGEPFSHNFIYGYYNGELMFVEPMVSLTFLQALSDSTTPVKRPQRYSYPGWYPSAYRIGFDGEKGEYTIALQELEKFNK